MKLNPCAPYLTAMSKYFWKSSNDLCLVGMVMLRKHVSEIGSSMLASNFVSLSIVSLFGSMLVPVQKLQRSTRSAPSENIDDK